MAENFSDADDGDLGIIGDDVNGSAAHICGPPMPKRATSMRFCNAVARRAAYISPEASPAEIKSGIGGMRDWCGAQSDAG